MRTHRYWILCPSHLTIVVKRRRSPGLLSCSKWIYSVTKIPLSSIVECSQNTSSSGSTLYVGTCDQQGKPGQKFEIVTLTPMSYADKVLEQRSVVQSGSGTQSTTPIDNSSATSTHPPDLRTNQFDAMIRSTGTELLGDQGLMRAPLAAAMFTTPYAGEPVAMAPPQPIDSTNLESADMIVNRAFGSIYSADVAWSDAYVPTNRLDEHDRNIEAP
jgi:hypothetical protein